MIDANDFMDSLLDDPEVYEAYCKLYNICVVCGRKEGKHEVECQERVFPPWPKRK